MNPKTANRKQWNKNARSKLTNLIVATALGSFSACGKDNTTPADQSVTTAALATDATLSAGIANANYSDALSASATQSGAQASLALDGGRNRGGRDGHEEDHDEDSSDVSKTCTVDGKKAIVEITGEIDRSMAKTSGNGRQRVARAMTGESKMKRTWSKTDDTPVACNSAGNAALIDWNAPDKLKLEVEFERSRERTMTVETPRTTRELSEKFSASGKRTILWDTSSTADDTATSYIRKHSVESSVAREMKIKNAKGEEKELKLEMKTAEGTPLVVQTERLKSDNSLVSRTIVSGTMVAKKEDADGTIETTYSRLKTNISNGECTLASGNATIVFKDAEGSPIKTYTLSVDSDGEAQLLDESGAAIDGFAVDGCDPEDMKL